MGMFNLSVRQEDENKPAEATNGVIDSPDTITDVVNPDVVNTADADKRNKTIVLDGPLSQIYTQALNIAYAKEGMGMMLGVYNQINKKPSDDNELDDSYVYTIGSDDLDIDTLMQSTESLRAASCSGKYKNIILAIESNGHIDRKFQLLTEMGEALGAKVCFSRENAISSVLSALNKE